MQASDPNSATQLSFEYTRLRNTGNDLAKLLLDDGKSVSAGELTTLMRSFGGPDGAGSGEAGGQTPQEKLAQWVERLIKIHSTEQRALHEEVAQLLTYSVNAAETEQVTQNIAITTLKLGRRTADALASRDVAATEEILFDSKPLTETVSSLPISPLIQSEMIDGIANWREGLATTAEGLRGQNQIISDMNTTAYGMITNAGALNDLFTSDADRIGQAVRTILVLGAAIGLLLGTGTAFIVARSITEPLRRLQERMIELAADPRAGPIAEAARQDELGSMASAVNFFVREISRREDALRKAKNRADATLAELQRNAVEPHPGGKARLPRPARCRRRA